MQRGFLFHLDTLDNGYIYNQKLNFRLNVDCNSVLWCPKVNVEMARFQLATFPDSLDCVEYFYLFFWPPDDRCHVPGFQCHRCNAQPTRATKRSPPTPREVPPISLPGLVPTFLDLAFCPSSSPRLALTSFPDPLLTHFLCRCKIIFVQTMQNSGSAVFSGGQVG